MVSFPLPIRRFPSFDSPLPSSSPSNHASFSTESSCVEETQGWIKEKEEREGKTFENARPRVKSQSIVLM